MLVDSHIMKMSIVLLLPGVLLCLVSSAKAQTTNDTDTLEPTCPPPTTCPPQPICTCPSSAECPTEGTRTRGRSPGRTRGTKTETNGTRTDTTTGRDRTVTTRTRTDTRTRPGTKTRKRCVPKVPRGCPTIAPPIITTTMAETTSTDANINTTEPFDFNDTTTEMDANTTEPFNVTEATTTEATTTAEITIDMNTTEPFDFNVTDANITEATTTEATTTEATTTEATTTEASTTPDLPQPPTTQSPPLNMSATCSSPVVDVTGQKEPPVRIFQFLVERHNLFEYAHEAIDLVEFIAWLVKLSNVHSTVKATLLGLSGHQSGLSVIIAVSFTVTPGNNYTHSSSQIVKTIYNHLEQLKVYYNVINIKLVSMTTLSYSPQSDHHGKTEHRVVITKPVIVLSVLAMVGLLGAVAAVSVKLMKWYGKAVSGEKRPLLEDRADGQRGFTLDG